MKRISIKSLIPSEYTEQTLLVDYMEILKGAGRDIHYTCVPNSTYTPSWSQKRKNTNLGLRAGFPDLVVVVNKKLFFIEMKRTKGGKLSDQQEQWHKILLQAGHLVFVCSGFDQAKIVIDSYL